MSFEENIKEWEILDNKVTQVLNSLKEIRNNKNLLENKIISYATQNKLQNSLINTNQNKLRFVPNVTTQSLTFKFLEESLEECIDDSDTVKEIITFIKAKREKKESLIIKKIPK